MKRFRSLMVAAVGLIRLVHAPLSGAQTPVAPIEHVTRLERLASSPLLLAAPADLQDDFLIAKEPPAIDFALFPNQWKGARLWSSWGDALFASDGNYYASIGDHGAPHGTAYVYRVDLDEGMVRLVADYNAVVGATDSARYSPGKIHGGLVEGADGGIYFFGYRGSEGQTTAETGYRGDWLIRYHPRNERSANLGIALPDCSVPVLLYHPSTNSLYGLAVPGRTASDQRNRFFRYRLDGGKLLMNGGPAPNMARAMILAEDGRAWYSHRNSADQDLFMRYDPRTNEVSETSARVPGDGQLRAASRPDSAGTAYCVSKDGLLFAFNTRTEAVEELGPAFVAPPLYTATCRLDPSGRYLYYLPGAHGGSHQSGTPLIQFNTQTRQTKVIAFLNAFLRETKGYNPGGTYGIAVNADGSQIFVNFNGAQVGSSEPDFGQCAAVVIHIAASERIID